MNKNAKLPNPTQGVSCSGFCRGVLLDSKYFTIEAGQGEEPKGSQKKEASHDNRLYNSAVFKNVAIMATTTIKKCDIVIT